MRKLSFRNPVKNKVVILDEAGSDIIAVTVLKDIKYTISPCSKEIFHITLPLLFLMLKNTVYFLLRPGSLNLKGVKKSSLLGCLHKIYLFSCIDYINPEIVLTFIDNNRLFHWISRMYENCEFYAIQNGGRNDAKRLHYNGQNDSKLNRCRSIHFSTDVISMPNLFCYGEYEVDLYKKHDQDVDNFYPVSSLKGGFYKTCVSRNNTKVDFDICLVSDQLLSFPDGHILSKFELGVGYLHKLAHRYVGEEHLSCCIAMRSTDKHEQKLEKEYFVNIFGDRVKIIKRNDIQMSTYAAVDRSSIVVVSNSTISFEAFGWGKKVLFCNLSDDDFYQSPLPEICKMNVNNYEIFKSKLDYLRQLDENEYIKMTESHARYLMNYDFDNPAHVVIRKMILEHLE